MTEAIRRWLRDHIRRIDKFPTPWEHAVIYLADIASFVVTLFLYPFGYWFDVSWDAEEWAAERDGKRHEKARRRGRIAGQ